jgi:hypothetical protein
MTKKQIYINNVKAALKLHKDKRWHNKKSVYNFIFWYTVKYLKLILLK